MSPWFSGAIHLTLLLYTLAMFVGLLRVARGPSAQDRVLALDFMYALGMLITLTLGIRNSSEMYFEAALLIALTGFVSSLALGKFLLRGEVIE